MTEVQRELEFFIEQNFSNLADLPQNEDLIIKYLLHRYEQGEIYTWVGPVLLAINPDRPNSDLYKETCQDYFNKLFCTMPQLRDKPHIILVAAQARFRLVHDLGKTHQAIIISGDSGSGKTFSAYEILNFLATTDQTFDSKIEKCSSFTLSDIVKACSIITAFSTASTERNKHSSRHGQLIQLQYLNTTLRGAVINSFLFEQSRVTSGLNNFHIFSQILAGLSNPELEALLLFRTKSYKLTSTNQMMTQGDHIKEFKDTVEAMNCLGFGEKQKNGIFRVLAVLIHLGNIQFKEQINEAGCEVDLHNTESTEALGATCTLLAIPSSDLVSLLTTNLIKPRSRLQRHSMYYCTINTIDACNARLHSIIRYLYYRLFRWLVNRLNEIITCGEDEPKLLGILDIFGFEFFAENSIEQLSINYASERLQIHFMEEYLEACRLELADEGLTNLLPPLTLHIYRHRIAALENGLFPMLNDACLVARIHKHSSLDQMTLLAGDPNQRFIYNHAKTFTVCHYSCPVTYRTQNILCKNTDKVPAELLSTFSLSQDEFIRLLLDDNDEDIDQESKRIKDMRKNVTTLAKLKYSMDALIKELNRYDLHYVRCMKPVKRINDPGMLAEFRQQLACSGILDVLPLARCGLPVRLTYTEFNKRYLHHKMKIGDPTWVCRMILRRVLNQGELQSSVHFGKQIIFLTEAVLYKLELMRDEFLSLCATKIQNFWRKYKKNKQTETSVLLESTSSFREIDAEEVTANQAEQKIIILMVNQTHEIHEKSSKVIVFTSPGEQRQPSNCDSNDFNSRIKCLLSLKGMLDIYPEYMSDRSFFHRKGMLSRRRLTDDPVRFHTRLTCLVDSHYLPRSELPRGLEDCL